MVNTNVQGVVPIDGVGFTAKLKRDYNSGEYRRLSNCQIEDSIIKNRQNIVSYDSSSTIAPSSNLYPFIGFIDDSVITVSKTAQYAHRSGFVRKTLWSPTSLPVDASAGSFHKIVGVFEYNNKVYWLTWQVTGSSGHSHFYVYHTTHSGLTDARDATFAMLTGVDVLFITDLHLVFDNFFIYKERLWIITNKGVFFSKVADPTEFDLPDGGFFKLRDQNINYAFSTRDGVYVLCDSSIHYHTYSSDPNLDANLREISTSVGADHGVQYNDTAYVVNSSGIYALSGNTLDLVKTDFDIITQYSNSKLVAWEEYLILIKTDRHNYSTVGNVFWPNPFADVGNIIKDGNGELGHNVWFINMTTGATHTLDFYDQFSSSIANPSDRGNVIDLVVNPTKDFFRTTGLTIMTSKCSGTALAPATSHVYRMTNNSSYFLFDEVVKSDNSKVRLKHNVDIIIDSYTPDGNEYLIKKFRNLLIMGQFPYIDFEVAIAYDNENYPPLGSGTLLVNSSGTLDLFGEPRGHYPGRIALNQRAKAISLNFRTLNPLSTLGPSESYLWDQLEISDIRVLWTYTGRGLSTKTPTNVT